MSYTTPNDFLLINNISTETIYEKLLNNDKILLDIDGETVGHKNNIDGYYNNLIKTNLLDITINNPFKNKILYYSNSKSKEYPDTFVINNNKNNLYNIIEIDNSYYASELINKYIFLYDFLTEYYRNLSIIKKTKYAIDNKSLYEHTFNMKIRYIYKRNYDNTYTIININNDNKNFYYYLVSFKLEDQDSKSANQEILIQPTGNITELDIDSNNAIDDHNNFQTFSSQEKAQFSDSFRKLFSNIIKKEHLQVNTELSYYHLLGLSYKFKFHKLLLTYYISKVIYFYFKKNYTTKIKEIDDIITQHYPRIFENYNQIVNNSTPNSLITIMKNSEKKVHVANKNKEKDLQKINNSISKLRYNKAKISTDIIRNNSKYSLDKIATLDAKFKKIQEEIEVLLLEKTKISEENYITKDAGEVQEAINYKSNLHNYNTNMINIDEKIKKMNKSIKSEKSYLEKLNLVNYFIIFLFIIILFSFILDYSTTIVNISIPIFLLTISVVIYLVIKYALKSRFNDNISGADLVSKNKHVIQSFYNAWGGKYLENFSDDSEDVELDPIVSGIIASESYEIGSNNLINGDTLDTLISTGVDEDITQKLYFSIPSSEKNIDLVNEEIFTTDNVAVGTSSLGESYSSIWTGWPAQPSSHDPQVNDLEILKTLDTSTNKKIATFVNDMSVEESHTKYILNIPEGIDYLPCQALVVGGGSFGGHIATRDVFDAALSGRPSVTNMGEGGAGGAVLLQSLNLVPGKYEIGVGRGGIWQSNLETSIVDGQAHSSYIKEFPSGVVRVLALGAKFEKYDSESSASRPEEEFNQQQSGGKNTVSCDLGGNCVDGAYQLTTVIKNREGTFSNGGRGGMIKPADGQVGWSFVSSLGTATDTYFLSNRRYEGNADTGTNGQEGVNVSDIFGTAVNNGIFAAGGGAASYCRDGDNDTFHEVDGVFYTCSSSEDRAGNGGNGGGGDGNSHETGKNGLHNTGSGGGGGKYAGGNGGSGIVLIRYDMAELKTKIQAKLNTVRLELTSSIHEIAVEQTATELYDKKIAIAELLREIKLDKQEIDEKYGLLDEMQANKALDQADIADYETLLRESKEAQEEYQRRIDHYNDQIEEYNGEIIRLKGTGDASLAELERIRSSIQTRQDRYDRELREFSAEEKTEQANETEIASRRATYLQKVANRLKAQACKAALVVAQRTKRTELLKLRKDYSAANTQAIAEAEALRVAAIKDALDAEQLRDTALHDQFLAEQSYKNKKKELLELQNRQVPESEKNYSVSFRLELDYRIAGLYGVTDNYYDGIDESTEEMIRTHLNQEKEKREMFVTNIIKELLFATSNLNDGNGNTVGTLPNRFQILRIHSGNLVAEALLEKSQAQIDEEEKNRIIFNYEKSAYRNEFNVEEGFNNYSTFKVTEHFVLEDQTEEQLLSQTRVQGYMAPDNATVIEMQIIAHPQKKKPYAKNILDELVSQSNILDSDLRSTGRYFRFLNAYKLGSDPWTLVQRGTGVISEINILTSNIEIINDIKGNFGIIKNLQADYPTYYDNVNPLLKKEHRIYKERNEKANIYNKLSENSQNVNLIEITKKELTLNFILNLCMLLAITMIILKFINNYIIFIIFIVIFIILLTNYIYNIVQTVRTKYKSNYWLKPRERKYINAS